MDWMFVVSSNLYAEILTLNIRRRAMGRWLDHEGGSSWMGLLPLQERPESSLAPPTKEKCYQKGDLALSGSASVASSVQVLDFVPK